MTSIHLHAIFNVCITAEPDLKLKRTTLIGWLILAGCYLSLSGQINVKRTLRETNHHIYHTSYSPDGKLIATTSSDNTIILWNAQSGIIYRTLAGLKKRPNCVVFTADGKRLFSAGEDGLITTWDPSQLQPPRSTSGHSGAIKALDISKDGTMLASGGEDKILRLWAIAGEQLTLVYELKGHKKSIRTLKFSPDGRTLISGGADKLLIKWDIRNGAQIAEVKAHDGWIRTASFSPDGRYIATGGDDKFIHIWNTPDLSRNKTLEGHTDWVQTLDYISGGRHIISGGHDKYIRIWEVESGQVVARSGRLEEIVVSVAASPTRNDIISSCLLSDQLRIWAHTYGSESPVSSTLPDQDTPPASDPATISITLFSPVPENGEVIHGSPSILIVGKADAPGGVQTLLINRQRAELSETGIFQLELPLILGENPVEIVAVSNRGNMSRNSFIIRCTDESASAITADQPEEAQGTYHALIIGINEYADKDITDLDYPITDADSLQHILVNQYAFHEEHIQFLKNPTRTEIIIALDELSRSVTNRDNLLIFYAGHGYWDDKSGIGYWLPHDAARAHTANWFRNSTLRDFIGSIQSRHTLLIADACFSGSIFKTRAGFSDEPQGYQKLHELHSRKAMTSGNLREVPDKSVFVKYLLQELNQNPAQYLPSEELFSSFKTAVLNNSPNVPQYGTIQNVGDEGGDFIFIKVVE